MRMYMYSCGRWAVWANSHPSALLPKLVPQLDEAEDVPTDVPSDAEEQEDACGPLQGAQMLEAPGEQEDDGVDDNDHDREEDAHLPLYPVRELDLLELMVQGLHEDVEDQHREHQDLGALLEDVDP